MIPELKILVASPGDVIDERECASQVIKKLQQELAGRVRLRAVLWEHNPVNAGETFQEQIPHPADAHIVITILWKRLGTPLPEAFADARGRLRTGTEFEYEEAMQSFERTGAPEVWVYRSKRSISLSPDPEEQKEERDQLELLDRFWKKWIEAKKKGHKWFPDAQTFEKMLETDLRATVDQLLEELQKSAPFREKLDRMAREWKEGRQRPNLLLPPGQMLKDAEDVRRSFAGELDPITDAFIRESLLDVSNRRKRKFLIGVISLAVVAVLLAVLAGLSLYFMVKAHAAEKQTEETRVIYRGVLLGHEMPPANPSPEQMEKIQALLPDCGAAYRAFDGQLKEEFSSAALDEFGSKFFDNYGRMLVRVGSYEEAEGPFQKALAVDERWVTNHPGDDNRQRYLFISHLRMAGLQFCKMKSKGSPNYQEAHRKLAAALAAFKKLADKARDQESIKSRADQFERLLKEFEATEFLTLSGNQAETVQEGSLGNPDLVFYLWEQNNIKYVPRCKVYAVELQGGKSYQFRLEAEKKDDKPSFDTYLLLQNGIYETVDSNDDFGKSTDAQINVRIWHTGTYRLFVASAPRPAPNLPPTGKFSLKIKATDEP